MIYKRHNRRTGKAPARSSNAARYASRSVSPSRCRFCSPPRLHAATSKRSPSSADARRMRRASGVHGPGNAALRDRARLTVCSVCSDLYITPMQPRMEIGREGVVRRCEQSEHDAGASHVQRPPHTRRAPPPHARRVGASSFLTPPEGGRFSPWSAVGGGSTLTPPTLTPRRFRWPARTALDAVADTSRTHTRGALTRDEAAPERWQIGTLDDGRAVGRGAPTRTRAHGARACPENETSRSAAKHWAAPWAVVLRRRQRVSIRRKCSREQSRQMPTPKRRRA